MGIFSGLFRSRDKPQNRTTGSTYSFFFGSSSAGKRVNERSAMQMTAVYSCVRILAEAVAGLPLHLYRYKEDGGKEKAIYHPLYLLLHDEPNPEMSSFVFRETLMTHLLLWGNAYAQIIRNGKGEVIALYPLMPDRMTVDRDRDGKLYYEYTVSTDDAPTVKGTVVRLKPSDVLHIPGLGFDGLVGYSPIAMAKNAIGMAIACEEYGAKFFANGAAPGGVLEHPGTIKDPGRVRESWQSTFGGSGNANKIAVLEEGMKYTGLSVATVAMGNLISSGIQATLNGIKELGSAIWNLDEATEEYRVAQGKLTTAFEAAGYSGETAQKSYNEFYKILGDTDTATEASQLLNLIKGIWNGIGNAASWLWNKVSGFCSNLLSKIKGFFGISSPSREMAWVGDMLTQGLAGGIEDGAGAAISAAEDLNNGILGVMNGLAADMQSAVPSNFAFDASGTVGSVSGSMGGVGSSSFGTLITIQQMIVRSEDDIRRISQELYNLIQTGSRAQGRFSTA